ncbi:MAG TPA: YCF48-related protein [Thermoanaerobaculia bacterium]|nr:YCF48-related protein [Thermoanaerobaculia bacterium]
MRHPVHQLRLPAFRLTGLLALALAAAAWPAHAGVNFWTPLGPDGGSVVALAVSPAQPSLVYAGSGPPVSAALGAGVGAGGGFFRSEDGGATWVRASRGIDPLVMAVVADPQTAATVYEISLTSTMKSVDAGATWSPVPEPGGPNPILSLAIDPRSPSTLYAGATGGIWKSTDGGRSWTALNFEVGLVTSIAVDSSPAATALYAFASDPGILVRSIDSGKTWSEADNGLPSFTESLPNAEQVVVDPSTTPATVYFSYLDSSNVGCFQRSTDMAASWAYQGPCPCSYPVAVGSGVVYAGPAVSSDHGATWTAAAAAPGNAQALAAAPGASSTVYAGTSQGAWKSVDAAATWQAASHSLAATQTVALAVDPVHPRILYAAVLVDPTLAPSLFRSGNSGLSWRPIGPPLADLQNLVIDPVTPTTLYAVSVTGLAKSLDSGNTWEALTTPCNGVAQLAIDPAHPDTLYAAGPYAVPGRCLALKSTDGGHTWSSLALPGQTLQIAVAPSAPATLYALTNAGIFKSTDAGVTWRRLRIPRVFAVALAIDPTDANRVFLAGTNGVFGTADGGNTWIELDHKLPLAEFTNSPPTVIAIDPHSSNIVYTAGAFGIYRSANGGKTWHPIVGGLPDFVLNAFNLGGVLVLDPQQRGKLYAGTLFNGVYTYTVE